MGLEFETGRQDKTSTISLTWLSRLPTRSHAVISKVVGRLRTYFSELPSGVCREIASGP